MNATKRVGRLVTLRTQALERARMQLARAAREAERRAQAYDEATSRWEEHAGTLGTTGWTNVGELAEAYELLDLLRRDVDRAAWARNEADRLREQRREEAAIAQRELKKMEVWRDDLVAVEREDAARIDRALTDEIAARRAGSSS